MTIIRKAVGWTIAAVSALWALHGLVSILSKLHFVMDAWNWGVALVPIAHRPIVVEFRHQVADWIAGYRELIHGLVQMLRLPRLPQLGYDMLGVVMFSVGRGVRILVDAASNATEGRLQRTEQLIPNYRSMTPAEQSVAWYKLSDTQIDEINANLYSGFQILDFCERAMKATTIALFPKSLQSEPVELTVGVIVHGVVYGGLVGIPIAALFGLDYLYRHFA
jgi:hypothetical protein